MLYFDPALVERAARDAFAGQHGQFELPQPVIGDRQVAPLLLRLLECETSSEHRAVRAEELLLTIVARAGRMHQGKRLRLPGPIARAKARIDDEPAHPATLGELAEASGLSRFQLLRGFIRGTGLTPHAYIVQRRVEAARVMIRAGVPLAEAAAEAGFADQSHMTRIFVRKYGHSPGALARAMRRPS